MLVMYSLYADALYVIFIDCVAGKVICFVASVCLSVYVCVCPFDYGRCPV